MFRREQQFADYLTAGVPEEELAALQKYIGSKPRLPSK